MLIIWFPTLFIYFIHLGKIKPSIQSRNDNVRYIRGSGEAYMQIGDTAIVKEGFTVKITCPFSAVPIGKLSWLRNGKLSMQMSRIIVWVSELS